MNLSFFKRLFLSRKRTASLLLQCALTAVGLAYADAQGIYNFYGTAKQGGPDGSGTIFRTSATGTNVQTQFSFPINAPGYGPTGGLTPYNGKLYGLTGSGGANAVGVLFEFDPATHAYIKKADFSDATTGSYPHGGLLLYNNKLYGATTGGGANSAGVLFEYDPATGALSNKADFDYTTTGAYPQGTPVAYNGKLYGTTDGGGANSAGTVYEYDLSSGTLTDQADFDYSTTGGSSQSNLILYGSKLYGTASQGGANSYGTLFEFDPATSGLTDIADFDYTSGAYPYGGLAEYNGTFYGMSSDGGNNYAGTLYAYDPSTGTLSAAADLDYSSLGGGALNGLTVYNSKLYGMPNSGGGAYGGTLIEYDPATAAISTLGDFNYTALGSNPSGNPAFYNGRLYAVAGSGGLTGSGTIVESQPGASGITKDLDINAYLQGATPRSGFLSYNGKLYGTASEGGIDGSGTLFEYDPATAVYTKKADFIYGTTGAYPNGDLIEYNGKLYGMTPSGGANGDGTLYQYDMAADTLVTRADFDNAVTGSSPQGSLTLYNGKLYGMTSSGGANSDGTVVEYDPASGTLSYKASFNNSTTGSEPLGTLAVYNGKLYGITEFGGANSSGTVVEFDPSTGSLTSLADFDYYTTGSNPEGSVYTIGNKLYGIANSGGANGDGTIFSFDPATAALTDLVDFNSSTTGYGSSGGLLVHNGKFYGLAGGGTNFAGVLFEYDTATGVLSAQSDFDYNTVGAQPAGSLSLVPARPAPGTGNTCESEPVIIGTGTHWIAITDGADNAVAEINPAGNALSSVSTDLYVNTGTIREDAANKLFLDRNVTITPGAQPASVVDVRIYISEAEYQALKAATNSLSQPSGISTMTDLALFKSSASCSGALPPSMTQLPTTVAAWAGGGYVLSASVTSFSTFYIGAAAGTPLPLTLLDIAAKNKGAVNEVTWNTAGEAGLSTIYLERSGNARDFATVAALPAKGRASYYSYTDRQPFTGVNYYRLRMSAEVNEHASYSRIVSATVSAGEGAQLIAWPNPVSDQLTIESNAAEAMSAVLKDVTGAVVRQFALRSGKTEVDVSSLPKGVYLLTWSDGSATGAIRIVK